MRCPDCREPLLPGSTSCHDCGWGKKKKAAQGMPDNFRCAYVSDGQRCTLPGSCTNSVHGAETWYCRLHLQAINDRNHVYGAQVIRDVLDNAIANGNMRTTISGSKTEKARTLEADTA